MGFNRLERLINGSHTLQGKAKSIIHRPVYPLAAILAASSIEMQNIKISFEMV